MDPEVRTALLVMGLLFIAVFGLMTVAVVAESGLDVLSVAAFLIIAMVLIGLIGAARQPPGK
jgi:hypothetical protein